MHDVIAATFCNDVVRHVTVVTNVFPFLSATADVHEPVRIYIDYRYIEHTLQWLIIKI